MNTTHLHFLVFSKRPSLFSKVDNYFKKMLLKSVPAVNLEEFDLLESGNITPPFGEELPESGLFKFVGFAGFVGFVEFVDVLFVTDELLLNENAVLSVCVYLSDVEAFDFVTLTFGIKTNDKIENKIKLKLTIRAIMMARFLVLFPLLCFKRSENVGFKSDQLLSETFEDLSSII